MTTPPRLNAVMPVVESPSPPIGSASIPGPIEPMMPAVTNIEIVRIYPPRWRYIRAGKRILPPRHAASQAHDTRKPGRSHCLIYWRGLVRLFQDQEEAEFPDAPLSHHW